MSNEQLNRMWRHRADVIVAANIYTDFFDVIGVRQSLLLLQDKNLLMDSDVWHYLFVFFSIFLHSTELRLSLLIAYEYYFVRTKQKAYASTTLDNSTDSGFIYL